MDYIPEQLLLYKEVCQELGYKWEMMDQQTNRLVRISNGKKDFYCSPYHLGYYPLNLAYSVKLANDKAWTNKLLQQHNYQAIEGDFFYVIPDLVEVNYTDHDIDSALKYANKLGYPVFVKPNSSSQGRLAEMIYTDEQLKTHLEKIAEIDTVALIQRPVDLPEYRLYYFDGKVEFIYRKSPLIFKGDGQKTIRQFIDEYNQSMDRRYHHIPYTSPFILYQIEKENLSLDDVLPIDKELQITSKSGVSTSKMVSDFTTDIPEVVHQWADNLVKIFNLRVAGIDIFTDKPFDPVSYQVIEVNGNPFLKSAFISGREELAKSILKKVLTKYFE